MHDPIPEKITSAWKSPPGGYKRRHPAITLCIEAEFDKTPKVETLALWNLATRLIGPLGDHAVEIEFNGPKPKLHALGLPIRARQFGPVLHAPLSWAASKLNWDQALTRAVEATESGFELSAWRGGGKHRHLVWKLEFDRAHRYYPGLLRLLLRTSHIPGTSRPGLEALIVDFFTITGTAGAYYGRGEFLKLDQYFSRVDLDPPRLGQIWTGSARRKKPLVPGAHRYNYLSPAHLNRLGTVQQLQAEIERHPQRADRPHVQIEPAGPGALIRADPLCFPYGFESNPTEEIEHAGTGTGALWLLAQCSKANMLAVQHLDWVQEEYEKSIRESAMRAPPKRPRPRSASKWLNERFNELRSRPPACIAKLAVAAGSPKNSARKAREHKTEFRIAPAGKPGATTLYGATQSDSDLLGSPIRAGSPKPERALFEFDQLRHGWDGAQSPPEFETEKRRMAQFKCPRCDGRHFELRAEFEYPDDLFDEDVLSPEQREHAEDFFTWFWLHARCPACSWEGLAADIECA